MFHFIIFITVSILSLSAFATRARVSAFQSIHLLDAELVQYYPSKLIEMPDFILFQSGGTTIGSDYNNRAYLSFKKDFKTDSSDFYSLGVNIGRSSDLVDTVRSQASDLLSIQYEFTANPIDMNYTVKTQGHTYSVGFFYANKNDKLNSLGNSASTLNLGYRIDDFTFSSHVGFFNSVEDQTRLSKLGINQSFIGRLLYELEDIYILLDISSSQVKKYLSSIEDKHFEFLKYKMAVVKNDFNDHEIFFYRFDLVTEQIKNRTLSTVSRTISLPLTLGLETDLNDQIILRTSIQQIIGVYKTEEFESGPNTTTAAVGIGLQFNKVSIDGTMKGLIGPTATQEIDSNQFLSETSLSYLF